jgi:hypothetical protein
VNRHFTLCIAVAIGCCVADLRASELTLTSSATRVPLIELYTSEGCSSCPPADHWLSTLKADPRLWREMVPIAFHVDYWDDLGWRDRYASPAHTERQRLYALSGGLSQVYTPGVVLQGHEWRNWTRGSEVPRNEPVPAGPLQLEIVSGTSVQLSYMPASTPAASLAATVALLGFDLVSAVKRGENAGRELHHDFVVLNLTRTVLRRDGDHYRATLPLPTSQQPARRRAVAAWVSAGSNPAPLQSVGGWLPAAAAN